MRGKPPPARKRGRIRGLIPACAGKTLCTTATGLRASGSSPRVRGKLKSMFSAAKNAGLIPACAGKTQPGSPKPAGQRAHPRVCGENGPVPAPRVEVGGSSPRVRGKPLRSNPRLVVKGLIPACAGKTSFDPKVMWGMSAHPRVCGENSKQRFLRHGHAGSSPRVRGKLILKRSKSQSRRLIPACAGKTLVRSDMSARS